ncbi:hypothetical protein JOL62DRAFT_82686 [Phyllosticta paracitricarpa]|uniref:Uncharacterized protein n=1 Tax=Phyllosticta paracitricarpa TaxID=2016321 RepID=A0ABR1NA53_9PEZI
MAPRPFSTAARVHPAIPVFHPQIVAKMQSSVASPSTAASRVKMLGRRVALPATGVLALGVAVSAYVDKRRAYTSPAASQAYTLAEQRQKERNAALTAAYGDRSSLEDIQKAMEMLSNQNRDDCRSIIPCYLLFLHLFFRRHHIIWALGRPTTPSRASFLEAWERLGLGYWGVG